VLQIRHLGEFGKTRRDVSHLKLTKFPNLHLSLFISTNLYLSLRFIRCQPIYPNFSNLSDFYSHIRRLLIRIPLLDWHHIYFTFHTTFTLHLHYFYKAFIRIIRIIS